MDRDNEHSQADSVPADPGRSERWESAGTDVGNLVDSEGATLNDVVISYSRENDLPVLLAVQQKLIRRDYNGAKEDLQNVLDDLNSRFGLAALGETTTVDPES
jgi:hypothetical protein